MSKEQIEIEMKILKILIMLCNTALKGDTEKFLLTKSERSQYEKKVVYYKNRLNQYNDLLETAVSG